MRFALKDIIVVGISTVIIAGASAALYHDFTARVSGGKRIKIGTITYKKKIAQRKYSGEVIWENVTSQDTVYNYDSIRTEADSSSIIKLTDGSEIELKENTLILLSLAEGSANIDFSRGSISAKATTGIKISAGNKIISASKGNLNLAAKKDQLKLNIQDGTATVDGKKIDQNQLAVIDKNKTSIQEKEFTLTSPGTNRFFLTFDKTKNINFSWKSRQQKPYILQVAADSGFTNNPVTRRINTPAAALTLKPGSWFWRVGYGEKNTPFSQEGSFTIIKEQKEMLISPASGKIFAFVNTRPMVNFKWSGSTMDASYRVEIASDPEFTTIARTLNSSQTSISTAALDGGKWYWRVTNVYPFGDINGSVKSPIGSFTLTKDATIPPPVLIKPANGYRASDLFIAQGKQILNWRLHDDIKEYRIDIAASPEMKTPRISTVIKGSYYNLTPSIPRGTWYWRVTGIDRDGNAYSSEVRNFTITTTAKITTVRPPDGSAIALREEEKNIFLAWNDPNRGERYLIELAEDRNFKKIINRSTVSGTSKELPRPEKNEFFWRVSLLDSAGKIKTESNTARVLFSTALAPPQITLPREGEIIDATTLNNLAFVWKKAPGATHYHLKVLHFARGFTRKIIEEEVTATRYIIKNMTLLDEGNFTIEIKSLKKSQNSLISQSIAQKRYFSIKLKQKLQNPEIISPNVIYIE